MKLYFEDKKINESTKWYDDERWFYPRKIAAVLNDTIRDIGKEGASVLVSDLMNELGLTYSDPSTRDSYRRTILNNIKNATAEKRKDFGIPDDLDFDSLDKDDYD